MEANSTLQPQELIEKCNLIVQHADLGVGELNAITEITSRFKSLTENTRHESAKTGVEVWQILDAVKDCSSFEDISNTNESCCDVDMIKLRTALTKLLEK